MVFLAREGTQLGSFPEDEVRQGLGSGRFLPTDSYFIEGMPAWRPLGEWPGGNALPRKAKSLKKPLLVGCGATLVGALLLTGIVSLVWLLRPRTPSEPFRQTVALFRTGMLHNWKGAIHRYGDEDTRRQFAEWSTEVWNPISPDVGWSYWFNTAVLTGVDLDRVRPRTAFYHPWSDTFWLAEWNLEARPRITRSWFGAGAVLRSGGKPPWDPTPLWLRGHGPRADALAAALAESIPAAERALSGGSWPDAATKKEPVRGLNVSLARMPLLELMLGIDTLRRAQAGEDPAVRQLRQELNALRRLYPERLVARLRDAPENTAAMRRALAALPDAVAGSLQPVCRVGAGRTAFVVLMPSQTADFALATVWEATSSRARLVRVDVLPFAKLLDVKRAGSAGRK